MSLIDESDPLCVAEGVIVEFECTCTVDGMVKTSGGYFEELMDIFEEDIKD